MRGRSSSASICPKPTFSPAEHVVADEVLEDDADALAQLVQVVLAQVDAVQQNLPFGRVVQAGEQLDQRRLAGAVGPDQGDLLARA